MFERQDKIEEERNQLIEQIEAQLQQQVQEQTLFTIELGTEMKNKSIVVQGNEVTITDRQEQNYISLDRVKNFKGLVVENRRLI